MICPVCNGEKEVAGIGCPGARIVVLPCYACGGTGEVSDNYPVWHERGQACRKKRMGMHLTLRQFCIENYLDPGKVARMEHGYDDPAPLEAEWESLVQGA